MEQKLSKLTEGLKEISSLVEQQLAAAQKTANPSLNADEDVQSASSVESFDSIIHAIISKIFKLQHANQNSLMHL